MPVYNKPAGFQCSCGKKYRGRPGFYRLQAHRVATGHESKNPSTNALPGKKRNLGAF